MLKGVEDADELEEQLAAVVVHVGDIEYGSHPCIFAWECADSFDVKYLVFSKSHKTLSTHLIEYDMIDNYPRLGIGHL